jgi:muramoyltetrapeptide carboxypeptidase
VTLLRPPALRPGDAVAVINVSSPVRHPEYLESGLRALESVGLRAEVFDTARDAGSMYDYLAADDESRARDLTRALTDPRYAAVFFARGGYGAQRTLQKMDWSKIDPGAPKVVVGYSDVTALLEAIAVELGWVSLFGPMVACSGFWQGPDEYSFKTLMDLLFRPAAVRELAFPDYRTIVPGTAEGLTLGGTATLIASNFGTDASYPAKDAILFLEEVDEQPYRLDRLITQIRRSRYLDGVAGILLGTFSGCGDPAHTDRMFKERLADLGVPVLAGANLGHDCAMQTYPIGVRARLDADHGTLTFLDDVLAPAPPAETRSPRPCARLESGSD